MFTLKQWGRVGGALMGFEQLGAIVSRWVFEEVPLSGTPGRALEALDCMTAEPRGG